MINSGKSRYYLLISLCIVLQTIASILSKELGSGLNSFTRMEGIALFIVVLLVIFLQAITWQFILLKLELSIAYPLLSFVYVLVFVMGIVFFEEEWTRNNVIGICLIALGSVTLCGEMEVV